LSPWLVRPVNCAAGPPSCHLLPAPILPSRQNALQSPVAQRMIGASAHLPVFIQKTSFILPGEPDFAGSGFREHFRFADPGSDFTAFPTAPARRHRKPRSRVRCAPGPGRQRDKPGASN
jgi:hypothetical protein